MKRGRLRTTKDYKTNKYKIQGKKKGIWVDAWDEEREKRGLPKELIFDLEYDACGYLQGFIDWAMEDRKIEKMLPAGDANGANVIAIEKVKADREKKKKQKMAKQSKRRNRR